MTPLSQAEYCLILRRDLTSFIERAFYELNPQSDLLPSPHIEVMATKLEACRLGKCKRLIIALPPRHLKSHCASISFPAWLLGHSAAAHIICASYGQELSEKFARDCRALMQSRWYPRLFSTRLSGRQTVHDFMTNEEGTRMATSVEGPLTGRGADFIIIDDPLKPDEALSESGRKKVNQWFDNTLSSRLNDKANGCIILVMQRLHQDDLVGHVMERGGWELLSFPAIAQEDDAHVIESPLGSRLWARRAGEVLDPERESLATVLEIRKHIPEFTFASQYLQNPIPIDGAMVKTAWLQTYDPAKLPERFSCVIQSWDTANKAGELNDYSVCTTWGVLGKHFYLLNVFRQRLNYPELKRKVVNLASLYSANKILIENKASGIQLIQELQSEVYGVTAYDPPPGTDKTMRLHAQTDLFENGFVFLPALAPWRDEYVTELIGFPGSKYDDQVDSTTQALAYLRTSNVLAIWERLGANDLR